MWVMVDGNDAAPPGHELLSLYDVALPQVYGYLLRRCGSAPLAEDLTSETFVAAVDAVCRSTPPELSVAWLIGVARNKLVDHWRRHERSRRIEVQLAESVPIAADDWEVHLDAVAAHLFTCFRESSADRRLPIFASLLSPQLIPTGRKSS